MAAIKQIIAFARAQGLEAIARALESAYVDDCNCSVSTKEEVEKIKANMPQFMKDHGFPIKGLACSGEPAPKELSEDGTSINIAGYQWEPLADEMKIMTPKLFIGKKKKGQYSDNTKFFSGEVSVNNITKFFEGEVISQEVILSKTATLYDPLGFAAPLKVYRAYICRRALIESMGDPLPLPGEETGYTGV